MIILRRFIALALTELQSSPWLHFGILFCRTLSTRNLLRTFNWIRYFSYFGNTKLLLSKSPVMIRCIQIECDRDMHTCLSPVFGNLDCWTRSGFSERAGCVSKGLDVLLTQKPYTYSKAAYKNAEIPESLIWWPDQ